MAEQAPTLTAAGLIEVLKSYPPTTKVYMSQDTEGNGYSTIGNGNSIDYSQDDGAIIIFPYHERLEYDEVFPRAYEAEE